MSGLLEERILRWDQWGDAGGVELASDIVGPR